MLDNKIINAVIRYQCPGCVSGDGGSAAFCYKKGNYQECLNHHYGTLSLGIGGIFLGLPKGFSRVGENNLNIIILNDLSEWDSGYDKFNIPVWKYLDMYGNTLVRGLSPRINKPFLHIILNDSIKEINCLEITDSDLKEMD